MTTKRMCHCRTGAVAAFAVLMAVAVPAADAQVPRPNPQRTKSSEALREVFAPAVRLANEATVFIRADATLRGGRHRMRQVALGTIVSPEGYILTKASEVLGHDELRVMVGARAFPAKVVGESSPDDLAMLKIDPGTTKLTPIRWADRKAENAEVGEWVATAGPKGWSGNDAGTEEPIAVGVVSVTRRRIPGRIGFLGVALGDAGNNGGASVAQVLPDSAAERAGLKVDDIITGVNGKPIHNRVDLVMAIHDYHPGDIVALEAKRGSQALNLRATLGTNAESDPEQFSMEKMLGGPVSRRATDFPAVLQHDTVIRPADCGGPLVDLSGNVIGINIARAGRAETYALPADIIQPLLAPLMSGKLAPVNANTPNAATRPGHTPTTLPESGE